MAFVKKLFCWLPFRRMAFATAILTGLSGCGFTGLMVAGGAAGVATAVGTADVVAKATATAIGNGLGCALAATVPSDSIDFEMEQSDLDRFTQKISTAKIASEAQFWAALAPADAAGLKTTLNDAYQKADPSSKLRAKPVEFYQNLFAYGLIQIAKEKKQDQASRFFIVNTVAHKTDKTTEYTTLGITVAVLHAVKDGDYSVAQCE